LPASDDLLTSVLAIAEDAAADAMRFWTQGEAMTSHWEKEPGQPVSDADLLVDRTLRARLGELLPEAAWLSEESVETPGRANAKYAWVVDPIDGTRDFVRGRPGWSVSVALVEDGAVVIGVLIAPARGERWWATRGGGAYRNDEKLCVGCHATLSQARVPADHLRGVDIDYVLVPKPNSIALRMAMVAADEADVVASIRWGSEWDIAAASLIAQEAGATVTDALGQPFRFNRPDPTSVGILCCVPAMHEEGVARLRERAIKVLGERGTG
jgi:myo-inositol-1(or 4)-monophosphatase